MILLKPIMSPTMLNQQRTGLMSLHSPDEAGYLLFFFIVYSVFFLRYKNILIELFPTLTLIDAFFSHEYELLQRNKFSGAFLEVV